MGLNPSPPVHMRPPEPDPLPPPCGRHKWMAPKQCGSARAGKNLRFFNFFRFLSFSGCLGIFCGRPLWVMPTCKLFDIFKSDGFVPYNRCTVHLKTSPPAAFIIRVCLCVCLCMNL